MRWNRKKKYMAVFLSLLMAFGGLCVPDRTLAQSVDKKLEIREMIAVLHAGGLQESRIYRVDDGEAEKVPALNTDRRTGRSTTQESVFERGVGDYGYKSLSQEQQSFYHRISESLTAFESGATNGEYTQITLDGNISYVPFRAVFADLGLDEDQASQVWIAFAADHPGLFWLENGCAISSDGLMPIIREDYQGEAAAMTQKRADVKTKIEQGIKNYLTQAGYYDAAYDQVRHMDTMIISAVDFAYQQGTKTPEEADWAHTIEGAFAGEHNAAVSEGYAKAFAFLLNILDIPNVYVTGRKKGTTESHAWNCVSFDNGNTYYCMDLAWDDMGADHEITGNSYQYFAMPKSKFEQKHQANTPGGTDGNWLYALPELGDDMDFTYFIQYGAFAESPEIFSDDEVRGFLSRVKALAPNQLSNYAVMVDNLSLSRIMQVMGLSNMSVITSEEYGMCIWANPLTDYSKGNHNPLYNLSNKELTIDLGSETETTLSLEIVSGVDGNFVRWYSRNNEVAVVKAPAYTKMEDGASVQIVAKKAGTAVICADGSNGGTMTCTVKVTGQRPAATPTVKPAPTSHPTSVPTETPASTPEPASTPGPTFVPTLPPGPAYTSTPAPEPTSSASPTAPASAAPGGTALPAASGKPEATEDPESTDKPGSTGRPGATGDPGSAGKPESTGKPGATGDPGATDTPSTGKPIASGKPQSSVAPTMPASAAPTGKPSASVTPTTPPAPLVTPPNPALPTVKPTGMPQPLASHDPGLPISPGDSNTGTTADVAGTKAIVPGKKSLVIAPGKTVVMAYRAEADAPFAGKPAEVTATVSGNKSVSAKVTDSGVLIAVDQKAVRGSAASLVLQSKNAAGSVVKAVVKVKVQNKVKKLSVKKKSVVLKKGRKTKIVLIVKAQNNKKAVTDAVKISSKLVRLVKSSAKKKKVILTLKGETKGEKQVVIRVGSKKVKVRVMVR